MSLPDSVQPKSAVASGLFESNGSYRIRHTLIYLEIKSTGKKDNKLKAKKIKQCYCCIWRDLYIQHTNLVVTMDADDLTLVPIVARYPRGPTFLSILLLLLLMPST